MARGLDREAVKILGLGFADVQDVGLMPPKRIESREMGFVRDVRGIIVSLEQGCFSLSVQVRGPLLNWDR